MGMGKYYGIQRVNGKGFQVLKDGLGIVSVAGVYHDGGVLCDKKSAVCLPYVQIVDFQCSGGDR